MCNTFFNKMKYKNIINFSILCLKIIQKVWRFKTWFKNYFNK